MNEQQKQLVDYVLKEIKNLAPLLEHNHILFDINEGSLLPYIEADLAKQFSPESYAQVRHRIAPINVLSRIVDKLSTLYAKPPKRTVVNGTDQDKELLNWYETKMNINSTMNVANELFNLHKTVAIEPFVNDQLPKLRAIPSDRSVMLSTDQVEPTKPTIWVKFMGKQKMNGVDKQIIYIYTPDFFLPVTMDGELVESELIAAENLDASNPIEALPVVYVNRSKHQIIPPIDTDMLRMTKIIPILISDLNYAVCFQAFSILYGIDVDTQNLKMAPNAFWSFSSDPTKDKTPQVGVIKPSVDIQQVMMFIQSQLSFWLNTKNIRAGTVGGLAPENFASGISKIIDEMDTAEDRQKQVSYFKQAEEDLWELITKKLHPYWMSQGLIDTNLNFSPNVTIAVEFQEQMPMTKRSEILKDVISEIKEGLTTKKRAIKSLNPDMTEDQILELISEIDVERTITIEEPMDEGMNGDTEERELPDEDKAE